MAGKVLHTSLAIGSTITASTTATGFDAQNVANWNLYDFWQGTSLTQNIVNFDLGAAASVDSFACYAHDLPDFSGTVKFQWSNDGSTGWTDVIGTVTPTDKVPIFKTFTAASKRYWRAVFDTTAGAPTIGIIAFGAHLEFQKGWRQGFKPIGLLNVKNRTQVISQTGLPLGFTTTTVPGKFKLRQSLATAAWVRSSWQPFIEAADLHPFFFMWDETNYPWEAVYAWKSGNNPIDQSITHFKGLMSVSLSIEAIHDL